ncbi:MAG: TraC family protein [Minisyncoccota bacterium]
MESLKPKQKQNSASSTQRYVDIEDIRDGIVIMKSGALRAVLLVSSLNFDLKATEEQNAIIGQYQAFLNSLDFSVQILINSRRFNVEPYLNRLQDEEKRQENELLRFQIAEYKSFIKNLTEVSNIMSKYFYVVVPFSPAEDEESGLFKKLFGVFRANRASLAHGDLFETYKSQLFQRLNHVATALEGTGVRVTQLNTEEVIELFYNSYNPSLFTTTLIKNVEGIELAPLQ